VLASLDLDKEFRVEADTSNYATMEVLSMKCSNELWRPVVFISKFKYFMKTQKLNRRQARWALYLSRFDFMLKHVLESKIGKADSLSRRLDWEIGVEKDNENEMLVKLEWLEVRKMEVVEIIVDGVDLLDVIFWKYDNYVIYFS